ncbi:MAG: hypothetical protein Q9167_005733 [Letrouitia subvulpina]
MAAIQSPKLVRHSNAPAAPRTATRTGLEERPGNRTIEAKGMGASWFSTASKPPKLRDSCNACSAAKIRCTKKRPTCARCDKRGLSCEYAATKRAGRPSHTSTQSAAKAKTISDDARQNSVSNEVNVPSPPSSYAPTSTNPMVEPSSALAVGAEFDDFFSSLESFPWLETPTHDILPTPCYVDPLSNTMDSSSDSTFTLKKTFPTADNAYSNRLVQPNPSIHPVSRYSITNRTENVSTLCTGSHCCCLKTALGFLKELSTNSSKAYALQGGTGFLFPPIQSVIAENKRVVKAIDKILQCFCSQDVYLLTVLSLIAFKILDWYAAVGRVASTVRKTADGYKVNIRNPSNALSRSSSSSASQIAGSLGMDSEDSGRLTARMVLGELHHVQRLVNNLSARFKGIEIGGHISASSFSDYYCDNRGAWPFSLTMLDLLESDLRKRLHAVSLEIVDMLI